MLTAVKLAEITDLVRALALPVALTAVLIIVWRLQNHMGTVLRYRGLKSFEISFKGIKAEFEADEFGFWVDFSIPADVVIERRATPPGGPGSGEAEAADGPTGGPSAN